MIANLGEENQTNQPIKSHLYFIPKVSIRYAITKAALREI